MIDKVNFQSIRDSWKSMSEEVHKISDLQEQEKIRQRLVWFKSQIDFYEFVNNLPQLQNYYQEITRDFQTAKKKNH